MMRFEDLHLNDGDIDGISLDGDALTLRANHWKDVADQRQIFVPVVCVFSGVRMGMTLPEVIRNTKRKMGHAFVLALLLDPTWRDFETFHPARWLNIEAATIPVIR